MNNPAKLIFYAAVFIAGAAIGGIVADKLISKTETEILPEEEIPENKPLTDEQKKAVYENSALGKYNATIKEEGYTNYSGKYPWDSKGSVTLIGADAFGNGGYECETLTLYSDGIVTDDSFKVVDNPQILIGNLDDGFKASSEKDVFYARNDLMKKDYEVLRNEESYGELLKRKPHLIDELLE